MNRTNPSNIRVLPVACAVAWLWFVAIRNLSVEWRLNEQYRYGLAVPLLCLLLLWRRLNGRWNFSEPGFRPSSFTLGIFGLLLAVLFAPARLIEQANPDWRLAGLALALIAVGVTLVFIALSAGLARLRLAAFPVLFFLVAVPWPTVFEAPVIQTLTRWKASASAELVQWFDIPALQHGNLIEVSRGIVGIDEACSGIRSLQASFMLACFFGDYFRLNIARRILLCSIGMMFSFLFNLARTSLLVMIAAKQGIPAMTKWHDPAGAAILIGCFTGTWVVSYLLRRPLNPSAKSHGGLKVFVESFANAPVPATRFAGVILGVILISETGVEWWYSTRERTSGPPKIWKANFPKDNPSYQTAALPARTRQLLRHDFEVNARWLEAGGSPWIGIFLQWKPGRAASCLARSHTPELCLPAAGGKISLSEETFVETAGLSIPVQFHRLEQGGRVAHVLYCLWSDQSGEQTARSQGLTYSARLAAVRDGQRLRGQRSLELAVWGETDDAQAREKLIEHFRQIVSRESN